MQKNCSICDEQIVSSKNVCGKCIKDITLHIENRTSLFPQKIAESMAVLENAYLQQLVAYSDEAQKRNWVGSQPVLNGPIIQKSAIVNGFSPNFTAVGKEFTSLPNVSRATAVRSFFSGPTICECEGATAMVAWRAICEVLGDALFDRAFDEVAVKLFNPKPINEFFDSYKCTKEDNIKVGDWVYIYNEDKGAFGDLALEFKKGAASSGWNLVCVKISKKTGAKKYLGFGLSTGQVKAMTLPEVKDAMVSSVRDAWVQKYTSKASSWNQVVGLNPDRIVLKTKARFKPQALVKRVLERATIGAPFLWL